MESFPFEDLHTIDRLWIESSQSRFGLSVQKKLWQDVGGKVDYETENNLFERLGWIKGEKWLSYSELTFDINAPFGHFPYWGRVGVILGFRKMFVLLSRQDL